MEPERIVHPRPSRRAPVDPAKLEDAIRASGLSLREVARRSGTTAPHLTGVLSGKHGISETKLRAVQTELGVTYASLLKKDAAA